MGAPTLTTERLLLRPLTRGDLDQLRAVLQDERVMYAWEHAFSDAEMGEWLDTVLSRYERDGFAFLAAEERETGAFAGVAGPLIETFLGADHPGLGYLFAVAFWGKGYATESAQSCADYLFYEHGTEYLVATIRPENRASRRVAERLGMRVWQEYEKDYRGKPMKHLVYRLDRADRRWK